MALQLFVWHFPSLPEHTNRPDDLHLAAATMPNAPGLGYLQPKGAYDFSPITKERLAERIVPQRLLLTGVPATVLQSEAVDRYVLNDDLQFNSPPLIYRQSSSEHSTEG